MALLWSLAFIGPGCEAVVLKIKRRVKHKHHYHGLMVWVFYPCTTVWDSCFIGMLWLIILPSQYSMLSLFSIYIIKGENFTKIWRELQVIKKKLQELSYQSFWGGMSVKVWSARYHFVPLTMRAVESSSLLLGTLSRLVLEIPWE